MWRTLAGEVREPAWPERTTLRTYDDDDGPQVKSLLDDAYAWDAHYTPQPHDQWLAFMTDHDEFDPSLWFLVERDGELVACALHWRVHNRRGWLKDLVVDKSMRGLGLGKALVRHGLRAYQVRDVERVGLKVDAANPTGAPASTRARASSPTSTSRSGGRSCDDADHRLAAALASSSASRALASSRTARSGDRERRSGRSTPHRRERAVQRRPTPSRRNNCSTNGCTARANHLPTRLRNTAAVTGKRGLVVVVAAVVALAFAGAAPAASVTSLERTALTKLKHAPVSAQTKTSARAEIARAAHLIRTLPNGRSYHILVALQEVASFRDALTEPRALALYGALKSNDDYFAKHWAPADSTDIVGADGVVYRYFGGHCFRFHPLANFGVLNARATSGDVEGTQELADALIARGVYQQGGGIGWEYDFPFSGGRAPWLSGMAQAVAAQAFSRAATTVPEEATTYMTEAPPRSA